MFSEYLPQSTSGKLALAVVVLAAIIAIYYYLVTENLVEMPDIANTLFGVIPRDLLGSQGRRIY